MMSANGSGKTLKARVVESGRTQARASFKTGLTTIRQNRIAYLEVAPSKYLERIAREMIWGITCSPVNTIPVAMSPNIETYPLLKRIHIVPNDPKRAIIWD